MSKRILIGLCILFLLVGCEKAIDDLAWFFVDTSDTDEMTRQIEEGQKCVNKCLEDGIYERKIDCIYYCEGCIECINS